MIKEFAYSQEVNIKEMQSRCAEMLAILEHLDEGNFGDDRLLPIENLNTYVRSLVLGQRESLGSTKRGSWSVAPNDDGMPSDARVEFIFVPTYIAVATLSRVLCDFPQLPPSIPGYMRALKKGMVFSSYRELAGHGYEADLGAIEALRILSMGRVPWLLHRHPEYCPRLKSAIDTVARDMASRLDRGNIHGLWGEDYSDGFRSAIETMRLTNDIDFMELISAAQSDATTISEEELPW